MDGVILLIILVPLIFLILLINILNRTGEQRRLLESLYDKINRLTDEVAGLTAELKSPPAQQVREQSPVINKPATMARPAVPEKETVAPTPALEKPAIEKMNSPRKEVIVQEPVFPATTGEKKPAKGTDMEKFIGENLANKIGIAVLVLGIAFFVKYAIDKNWINEAGRVIIGLVCGGLLIGFAHYFRNSYRSFSSVLVGGGLTVFYFSIAFAFHQYHLIGQTAAFVIMVLISGFGVLLSLFYNRQELAILATIGGFITPFLVSTGQENYIALFTYLCILNTGLMVLSWFKRWPAINIIALFFTTIIYGGWLFKRTIIDDPADLPSKDALVFASLFYLLFVAMNIINSIRLKRKFTAFDFIIVLSTNFLYYLAGMIILGHWTQGDYRGLFTGSLGVFNLLLAAIFYRNKTVDRNFISLLIGLSVSFISLIAPVQFHGNHIVLFWAAESVILFMLYQRSRIVLLELASQVVMLFMLVSLVVTWAQVYFLGYKLLPVIANKGFITTLAAAVALFIYYILLRRESNPSSNNNTATNAAQQRMLAIAIIIAYLAGALEIWYQFTTRYPQAPVDAVYLQAYTFSVVVLLLYVFRKSSSLPLMKFLFTAACYGLYLSHIRINYTASLYLLTTNKSSLFVFHWVAAAILLWLLYDLVVFFFKKDNKQWASYSTGFTWIAATGIILLLSVEMYHIILWTSYRDAADWAWWENLYYKAGLSILWGLGSFAMMWLGMKKNFKPLRIISLSLFTVTIIKLFVYDIRNIPPGGKIAAFILLGVLLLAVSFMYQRLKKIIIDNTPD